MCVVEWIAVFIMKSEKRISFFSFILWKRIFCFSSFSVCVCVSIKIKKSEIMRVVKFWHLSCIPQTICLTNISFDLSFIPFAINHNNWKKQKEEMKTRERKKMFDIKSVIVACRRHHSFVESNRSSYSVYFNRYWYNRTILNWSDIEIHTRRLYS